MVVKTDGSVRYEWNVVIDSNNASNFTGASRQLLFIPGEEFVKNDRVVFDGYFPRNTHLDVSLGGLRDEGNRKHDWQLAVSVSKNRHQDLSEHNRWFRERFSKQAMGVADGYDDHIELPAGYYLATLTSCDVRYELQLTFQLVDTHVPIT